ncbi:MAG: hypothetical protein J6T10_21220 [Methanobrevibacter sp.]|nr:hypothetical protein [Methanobrevibacter sp.]
MAYPDKDRYIPNKGTAGHSNWQEGDYVTAANMNHIEDGIDQAVQDAETYADAAVNTVKFIGGSSAPTTSTVGTVGQKYLYTNGTTKIIYECVDASNPYKWEILYRYDTAGEKWYRTDTDGDIIDVSSLIAEFEGDLAAVVKDIEDGTIEAGKAVAAKSIENVSEDSGSTQDEPFVIQGTGTANGTASVDTSPVAKQLEKQGNSAVVNQQIYNTTKNDTIDNSSGSSTIYGNWSFNFSSGNNVILNHEYIVMVYGSITVTGSGNALLYLNTGNNQGTFYNFKDGPGCTIKKITSIQAPTATAGLFTQIGPYTKLVFNGSVHMIDLTQWFNGNIPQDIIADPKRFFNYYGGSLAYNAGTLTNGTGRYLVNKHRNLWDEEAESGDLDVNTGQTITSSTYIRSKYFNSLVPGSKYYLHSESVNKNYVFFYDQAKNFISYYKPGGFNNEYFNAPANAFYFKVTSNQASYASKITISLYYSPDEGGADYDQYFPYEVPSVYETGNEVLRSAGEVRDIKTPDGTITRYVGSVDLSTLSWNGSSGSYYVGGSSLWGNTNLDLLHAVYYAKTGGSSGDNSMEVVNGNLVIHSTATPTGILYFRLATPTTEQGTTFAENIEIDDYGTMEWLSTYDAENPNNNVYTAVPQACKIFYPADMVLFLDSLGQRTDIDWDAENVVSQSQLAETNQEITNIKNGTTSVGHADTSASLDTELGVDDETPFAYQTAGGESDITTGMQQLKKLVGCKIVKNQLVQPYTTSETNNGVTRTYNSTTKKYHFEGTINNARVTLSVAYPPTINGHKYLIYVIVSGTSDVAFYFHDATWAQGSMNISVPASSTSGQRNHSGVKTASATTNLQYLFDTSVDVTGSVNLDIDLRIIDLTQMFGNNNIVSALIPSTTDAENSAAILSFLGGWLPTEYDTGSFTECKSAKLKMVDYNLYNGVNEVTGTNVQSTEITLDTPIIATGQNIAVIAKTTALSAFVNFKDENNNLICEFFLNQNGPTGYKYGRGKYGNADYCIPVGTIIKKIKFFYDGAGATTGSFKYEDIAVFNYWDGSRIGYEPYAEHIVNLPNQDLNGILVLSDGNVVADGDELYPNGEGNKKRYGTINLGTLDWNYNSTQHVMLSSNINDMILGTVYLPNIQCTKYMTDTDGHVWANTSDKTICIQYNYKKLMVCDSTYTDATVFKTAMNGVYLIYELAEEQDLEASTFAENIYVDDFGTMQFLDENDNQIVGLQGNEVFYKANIAGFAESLYAKTDGDPDDLVTQEDLVGYDKTEDLSSFITDAIITTTGLKVIKIGKLITISGRLMNDSGSSITAETALFKLPSSVIAVAGNFRIPFINGAQIDSVIISASGELSCSHEIVNGAYLHFSISYAVA